MFKMVRVSRSQSLSVLALCFPAAETGFKMLNGTMKSDVRMIFLSQSIVNPWGENCESKTLNVPAASSGHSCMILLLASVSTMVGQGLIKLDSNNLSY